jgi:hypothetical protein
MKYYITLWFDDQFVVCHVGDEMTIIDSHEDPQVLMDRYGSMAYVG